MRSFLDILPHVNEGDSLNLGRRTRLWDSSISKHAGSDSVKLSLAWTFS